MPRNQFCCERREFYRAETDVLNQARAVRKAFAFVVADRCRKFGQRTDPESETEAFLNSN
jgi:hypothetical protein